MSLSPRQVLVSLLACRLASAGQDNAQNKACFGFEEEWSVCKGLPDCKGCIPSNCTFNEWGQWSYWGGCTELCVRTRAVKHENNECGAPCSGTEKETKKCNSLDYGLPSTCQIQNQSCELGDWEAWSPTKCESAEHQQIRTRPIAKQPKGIDPTYCSGSVKETRPCGYPAPPQDCTLSTWSAWTTCDKKCGGGYIHRSRHVDKEAAHGGTCPKKTSLSELQPCNEQNCEENADCKWGEWSAYTSMDGDPPTQLSRNRQIIMNAKANGVRCSGPLFDIKPIPAPIVANCSFSAWEPWSVCSKLCGSGQMSRSRSMNPWAGIGKCPMQATEQQQGCNTQLCGSVCSYSTWTVWSKCSAVCGQGSKSRSRIIATPGFDCDSELSEVAPCNSFTPSCQVAKNQNCLWSQWKAWGTCSATCGGGITQRTREVEVPAGEDGLACPAMSMAEVAPCMPQDCHPCVNGTWQTWTPWTACSSTCDEGMRSRKRKIQTEANYCGIPATGTEAEHQVCTSGIPCVADTDCALGLWGAWSGCSPSCFGVTERTRLMTTAASGNGKACTNSTKEIQPCNPGFITPGVYAPTPDVCTPAGHKDCKLSTWGAWSKCTAACQGTQHRSRRIEQVPMRGEACVDQSLHEVQGCSTPLCKPAICDDCQWGQWREWGLCGQCKGQHSRTRSIEQLPNYCGEKCKTRTVQETQNCTGFCESVKYCVWQEWGISESCPMPSATNCGPLTFRRSRSMAIVDAPTVGQVPLAKGASKTMSCQGYETKTEKCKNTLPCAAACQPTNCAFGPWVAWSTPTCTGICERSRAITTASSCGGLQCDGVIVETKPCSSSSCEMPVDCQLSNWSFWTPCGQDPTEQTTKIRTILQVPRYGGKPCPEKAALKVTAGCWEQEPKDCKWAEWSVWSNCTKKCGSGTQKRHRGYAQNVEFQGLPCEGDKEEVLGCNMMDCPLPAQAMDCQWEEWNEWSCGIKYKGMQSRHRTHKWPLNSIQLKTPCVGTSEEMKPCDEKYSVPAWGKWSECTKKCGGGQMSRSRAGIVAPAHGVLDNYPKAALPATIETHQTVGCNEAPCKPDEHTNCTFTPWQAWTPCSSTCGPGQTQRSRTHMTLRHVFGFGCKQNLVETKECVSSQPCATVVDCAWGLWASWATCNAQCGGGEMVRVRSVLTSPVHGGKSCDAKTKEEAKPCNTQPCKVAVCTDGIWGIWDAWSACTLTCDPGNGRVGLQERARTIGQMPNHCGKPLEGESKQMRTCNPAACPSQDCSFGGWSPWTGCSNGATCGGYQTRKRSLAQIGYGPTGKQCKGATEETIGCPPCKAVAPVDCVFSAWLPMGGHAAYNGCSVPCGGGRKLKKRHIMVHASNGGKACEGALQETESCNEKSCKISAAVDCKWGLWGKWSACDRCGPTGQKSRSRTIAETPKNGGVNCTLGDSEQLTKCDEPCGKTFCTWATWQNWGECDAKCGSAQKSRRRYLDSTGAPSPTMPPKDSDAFSVKYAELEAHLQNVRSSQWRDLSLAFGMGGVAFVVAMSAVRMMSSAKRRRSSTQGYSRMLGEPVSEEPTASMREISHGSRSLEMATFAALQPTPRQSLE